MTWRAGSLTVTGVEPLSSDAVILQAHAPWLEGALPGQFVMLRLEGPFLARPMSVMDLRGGGEVAFQVRAVGRGTAIMCDLDLGTDLAGWGPLGRPFEVRGERPVLVGGGVGMAPMFFLYKRALKGRGVTVIEGNRDADGPFLGPWLDPDPADTYVACTDDGSAGLHGPVTTALEPLLADGDADQVYACGPDPMLRAVEALARTHGVPCQVALEARMACGAGGCRGCWDHHHKIMVCCDGPVVSLGPDGAKEASHA